jgi:hypothetical protein
MISLIKAPRSIVVDQSDIDAALKLFKLESYEYHLVFSNNAVHLHWATSFKEARRYVEEGLECVDLGLWHLSADHWTDVHDIDPEDVPEIDCISCRYILQV